jgi:hypothetical protein
MTLLEKGCKIQSNYIQPLSVFVNIID